MSALTVRRRMSVDAPDRHGARWVIVRHVERRARLWALLWGAVFGVYVLSTVRAYASLYPTVASRRRLASSLQAFSSLLGVPHHAETVAGFTSWRVLTIFSLIGAIWGLLTATGLLRGQEDVGQWELLLAGATTRRRATAQAMAGLGLALVEMYAVTALLTIIAGRLPGARFGAGASLLFAATSVAAGAMFLAVGSLTSQLSGSRGQAATFAAIVLGGAFLVRLVGDSRTDLGWLVWLSPLGWIEEIRPLRDTQPAALVPVVAVVTMCAGTALLLAGRRDVQAGVLPASQALRSGNNWLRGPTTLALRLLGPGALGWLVGMAIMAGVYGLITRSSTAFLTSSPAIGAVLARLGVHRAAEGILGSVFLMYDVIIAVIACLQIAALREEEAAGRLDNLLVQPVRRVTWLAERVALALVLLVLVGVVSGFFTWYGAAIQHSGFALSKLEEAGLNALSPGIFVLGAGVLAFGLLPRACVAVCYAIVGWSFLVDFLGAFLRGADWLRDSSLFTHVALAPAAEPDWGAAAIMIALGAGAGVVGAAAFSLRDVAYT